MADAILDRLIHNAHRLKLAGESIRKQEGKLTGGPKAEESGAPASLRSDDQLRPEQVIGFSRNG